MHTKRRYKFDSPHVVCSFLRARERQVRVAAADAPAERRSDNPASRCLLTSDFTSISREGRVRVLADELAVAAENKGTNLPIPSFAKITVFMHGNVAVAYATVNSNGPDGRPRTTINADYYVWENGTWHAFFSQQTQTEKQLWEGS